MKPCPGRTVLTTAMTRGSGCSQASPSILPSRYGRHRLSSQKAIVSRCVFAERIMSGRQQPARNSPISRTSYWDADRFCTMIPAIGRTGCTRKRPRFISTERASATSWFRSSQVAKINQKRSAGSKQETSGRNTMGISRRGFGSGVAGIGLSSVVAPIRGRAAEGPIRIGLLTVKTGPLASGGIDMEHALIMFLKERDYMMSGRKVELVTADTAGVPATARTKTQEMVEKNNVHWLVGPLAAFEALAIDDYIRQAKIPTLSVAAAEDMTQRSANPWFVRATSTSSQCAHPLGEYAAKELKYKRMITIADDIAYGQEMCAGFQRVFEDNGGQIVQKLFPPLTVPDYGSYIGQLKNADAMFLGFAGSNGFRFLRQFVEFGQKDKLPVIGGMTALDEAVLGQL